MFDFGLKTLTVFGNVLKIGLVAEPKKLPIHGSLVESIVEPLLNR